MLTRLLISLALVALSWGSALADPDPVVGRYTLTTRAAEGAGKLAGVEGHYQMVVSPTSDGYTVTLIKTGFGKKKVAEDKVLVGAATVKAAKGVKPLVLGFRLDMTAAGGARIPMEFEMQFTAEGAQGYWQYTPKNPNPEEPMEATVYGGFLAVKGAASQPALGPKPKLTCSVCCNIAFRCGAMGPGACNSSNTCHAECEEKKDPIEACAF